MEFCIIIMEVVIKVILNKIEKKDMEFYFIQMEIDLKANSTIM